MVSLLSMLSNNNVLNADGDMPIEIGFYNRRKGDWRGLYFGSRTSQSRKSLQLSDICIFTISSHLQGLSLHGWY